MPAVFVTDDVDYDRYADDEARIWTVCLGDDDGEAIGKIYTCWTRGRALELGERMARDRGLELVID
jgi:hypothetical protein